MPAFKVNETLSKTMSYKGDDGLSDAERQAYEVCRPLSGKHEACYKRLMYAQPKKQKADKQEKAEATAMKKQDAAANKQHKGGQELPPMPQGRTRSAACAPSA